MSASATPPTLDVVICTYNNAEMLNEVLAALARQQAPSSLHWSCLVVDNNCTDHTQTVVEKYMMTGEIPDLRVVREPEQGLTPARMRGVLSSTAPWIAFVDDDCILEADWIAQAASFAENHPCVGAFGGKVVLEWAIQPPSYFHHFAYSFAEQDQGEFQKRVPFVAGAGLVVSRSALARCGWIERPLLADRVGETLVSGGDVEIVLRISGHGYELWYVPECKLHHKIPVRRISLPYLIEINRGLGISQALADALVWDGTSTGWVSASARKLAKAFQTLALAAARRQKSLVELRVETSFRVGQLQGFLRIVTSPSRRRKLLGVARPAARRGDPSQPRAA
jgi:GT2 family glycosyltransferase